MLEAASTPANARIYVDGRDAGRTPATLVVPAGARRVQMFLPNFVPVNEVIDVVADSTTRLDRALERHTGRIVAGDLPPGAMLKAGGEASLEAVPTGRVPVSVTLASGEVFRALATVDYEAETRVDVSERALDPLAASLALAVPGGAQIRGGRWRAGAVFAVGTAAAVAAAVLSGTSAHRAQGPVDRAFAVYDRATTAASALAAWEVVEREAGRRDHARMLRNVFAGSASALAIGSTIDAFVHHVRRPGLVVSRPVRPLIGLSEVGVSVSF